MAKVSIKKLKEYVKTTFDILGADFGLEQNSMTITSWRDKMQIISEREYHDLRDYNRKIYSELPLDK